MDEEHFPCDMSEFNLSETAKEIAAPFESLAIMQEKFLNAISDQTFC